MRVWSLCLGLIMLVAITPSSLAGKGAPAADMPATALSEVGRPAVDLSPAVLATKPQTELAVSYLTSKGEYHGTFRGVLLWTLLVDGGLVGAPDPHGALRRSVVVTGKDGYAVVFGMGEIAPELGAKPILLATALDGRSLPADGNMRLVVAGDKHGARSVRDVVSIAVRSLDP